MSTRRDIDDEDGGAAFPTEEFDGLSLRDYFAAAALTGLLARNEFFKETKAAEDAYWHADAMLQARTL